MNDYVEGVVWTEWNIRSSLMTRSEFLTEAIRPLTKTSLRVSQQMVWIFSRTHSILLTISRFVENNSENSKNEIRLTTKLLLPVFVTIATNWLTSNPPSPVNHPNIRVPREVPAVTLINICWPPQAVFIRIELLLTLLMHKFRRPAVRPHDGFRCVILLFILTDSVLVKPAEDGRTFDSYWWCDNLAHPGPHTGRSTSIWGSFEASWSSLRRHNVKKYNT